MNCAVCGANVVGDDSGLFLIDHVDGNITRIPYCKKHQEEAKQIMLRSVSGAS